MMKKLFLAANPQLIFGLGKSPREAFADFSRAKDALLEALVSIIQRGRKNGDGMAP